MRSSPARRWLFAEALVALLVGRLTTLRLCSDQLSHALGPFAEPGAGEGVRASPSGDLRAEKIGAAVRAAAPWLPVRAQCLEQAIAARAMLRRRGIASILRLGVSGDARALHAWLDTGDVPVTGYPLPPATVEIARGIAG